MAIVTENSIQSRAAEMMEVATEQIYLIGKYNGELKNPLAIRLFYATLDVIKSPSEGSLEELERQIKQNHRLYTRLKASAPNIEGENQKLRVCSRRLEYELSSMNLL